MTVIPTFACPVCLLSVCDLSVCFDGTLNHPAVLAFHNFLLVLECNYCVSQNRRSVSVSYFSPPFLWLTNLLAGGNMDP